MNKLSEITSGVYPAAEAKDAQEAKKTREAPKNYGATIGKPELSEAGAKYYEELKKKYSGMDFVLVSKDQIDNAKNKASSFGNKNRMVVLIDEEKIERMAADENYRKKYEGLIATAKEKMPQLQKMMESNPAIKTIGMQVNNDGRASFFAVMDKSGKDLQQKIEERRAAKKEAAKAAEKKAEKKERAEKLEEARSKKAEETDEEDVDILMANSVEELMQKIDDWSFNFRSDNIETAGESLIGHNVDFKA